MLQVWLCALIVAGCAAYVTWALLLPAAGRRRIALALLRRRWPLALQRRLQAIAHSPAACACDGCDAAPNTTAAPAEQPVRWAQRRRP
jgi:hypothetical protein